MYWEYKESMYRTHGITYNNVNKLGLGLGQANDIHYIILIHLSCRVLFTWNSSPLLAKSSQKGWPMGGRPVLTVAFNGPLDNLNCRRIGFWTFLNDSKVIRFLHPFINEELKTTINIWISIKLIQKSSKVPAIPYYPS